jgi:hypothetical protein
VLLGWGREEGVGLRSGKVGEGSEEDVRKRQDNLVGILVVLEDSNPEDAAAAKQSRVRSCGVGWR